MYIYQRNNPRSISEGSLYFGFKFEGHSEKIKVIKMLEEKIKTEEKLLKLLEKFSKKEKKSKVGKFIKSKVSLEVKQLKNLLQRVNTCPDELLSDDSARDFKAATRKIRDTLIQEIRDDASKNRFHDVAKRISEEKLSKEKVPEEDLKEAYTKLKDIEIKPWRDFPEFWKWG